MAGQLFEGGGTRKRSEVVKRNVRIIGVPMDLGQSRRGVDMGPSAIRYAGLDRRLRRLGHDLQDAGNVPVTDREALPPETGGIGFAHSIEAACRHAYEAGRKAVADGCFPLFLGGDHSMAIGSIGGITHDAPTGVIWIDAHGDFNIPETSPNGNIHGMPVAVLLGYGLPALVNIGRPGPKLKPADVVLLGTRDLDYDERNMLRDSGITIFTMRDIDERGIGAVARDAIQALGHCQRIHVSLDMDILDPAEAPGVGTPAPGGITYREAHLLMETLADTERVSSMDIVEINPILDTRNQTAHLAVELAASLLGQRIL
jgi:arginase